MVEPCATLSIENGNVKCLTRLLLEKLKNSIFEIPIIPQALNINNYRIASESLSTWISLEILSNTLLKNLWSKTMFTITAFEKLLLEVRLLLSPAQRGTGSEKVKFSMKKLKNIRLLLKLLEKWLTFKVRRFWTVLFF